MPVAASNRGDSHISPLSGNEELARKGSPAALTVAPITVRILGGGCRYSVLVRACEDPVPLWQGVGGVGVGGGK